MMTSLRKVEKNDWKFILDLRNQKEVRLACHDTSIIDYQTHLKYMQKMAKNPYFFHWIITYHKKDVGYIKIVNLEFGSMLLNDYRGRGIGKLAYELVFKEAKKLGSTLGAPYMTLSFLALLVIPKLKLSDKGLFDGEKFQFTSLYA